MMNIPNPKPTSRWLRQLADAGKDLETQIVSRWAKARRLVSVDQRGSDEEIQTGFVDKDHWLTGNTDAVLLPKGWDRLFPVEMKSKALERVIEMRRGERGPDENQVRQAKTYIGFGAETLHETFPVLVVCEDTWKLVSDDENCPLHGNRKCLHEIKIKPTTSGSLYYYARDDPFVTHEYFLKADPYFMWQGRQKLAQWRDFFKDGTLPQSRVKEGRHSHPFGWRWTELPCKYCDLKAVACKPDHLAGVTTLGDSCAIDAAKEIRPNYDYDETRKAVLNRWEGDNNG
jgi:acetone carboxylase gamma subunit